MIPVFDTISVLEMCVWLPAALIVLGATEAVIVTAIIAAEVAGAISASWLLHERSDGPVRWGPRAEQIGCFMGQIFVGLVTPYLTLLVIAGTSKWVIALTPQMLTASGAVAGITLGFTFLAGMAGPCTARPAPERPGGAQIFTPLHRRRSHPGTSEAA